MLPCTWCQLFIDILQCKLRLMYLQKYIIKISKQPDRLRPELLNRVTYKLNNKSFPLGGGAISMMMRGMV